MPYALTGLRHGEPFGFRAIASENDVQEGEALWPSENPPPKDHVWDSGINFIRPKTADEKSSEEQTVVRNRNARASALTTLRNSKNIETQALVKILDDAGLLRNG